MEEIEMIRYLLDEIENEIEYKGKYEVEKAKALEKAKAKGSYWWRQFMEEPYTRTPRKSIIVENTKLIRRLAMKIKEVE